MKWNVVMGLVVVVTCVNGETYLVRASGEDDTAAVQGAMNRCVRGVDCVVELEAGVYRMKQIFVENFRGRIRGAGMEATIIEPLGRLEVDLEQLNLNGEPPAATRRYPTIWTFENSDVHVSDLGFRVTRPDPAMPYQNIVGWGGPNPATHLLAMLWVFGKRSSVEVVRCGFIGGQGTFPQNSSNPVNVHWGVALWGRGTPLELVDGGLRVAGSVFRNLSTGVTTQRTVNGRLVIGGSLEDGNLFDKACFAVQSYAMSNASMDVSHNVFRGCGGGQSVVWIEQTNRTVERSRFFIGHNLFELQDGYAISVADYVTDGQPRLGDFVIANNTIRSVGPSGGGISVVNRSRALAANEVAGMDVVITNNVVEGASTRRAIYLANTGRATIVGNDVSRFRSTLGAPYFLQACADNVLVGDSGSVLANGPYMETHMIRGVERTVN